MSQHPADLKPRGVKPMLSLIPWSAVPEDLVPPLLVQVAEATGYWDDGSAYVPLDPQGPRLHAYLRPLIAAVGFAEIARAFAFGAGKYGVDNWKQFQWDDAADLEYRSAVHRHLLAAHQGEMHATDSNVRHEAHAAAGIMIMAWHQAKGIQEAGEAAAWGALVGAKVVTRAEASQLTLQVGSRVRVLSYQIPGFVGSEGVVSRIDPYPDTHRVLINGDPWWFSRDQLEAL